MPLLQRAQRPYPPTQVTFNGVSFPTTLSNASPIAVAWKRRDRFKTTVSLPSDPDEQPQLGTEYILKHEGVTENLGSGTSGSFNFLASGTHEVEMFARFAAAGLDSPSLIFTVTVTDSPAVPGAEPSVPNALVATPSVLSNVLDWQASTGSPIGYRVYGRQGAGAFATATDLGSTVGLTFTHSGLTGGAVWRYWVVAYNGFGSSTESNEATATAFSGGDTGGSGYTGTGDPVVLQQDGDTYLDTSQVPPVSWVQIDGVWIRQGTYDIAMTWVGPIPSLKAFLKFQAVRGFTLPDDLAGSKFEIETAPIGGDAVITLRKSGVDIGTLTVLDGTTTPVVVFTQEVRFEDGDDLELYSALSNYGMRGIFITFAAYR